MAAQNQKKKILCVLKILSECTDDSHVMTAAELCKALETYGIKAERKSIYSDIEVLKDCGIDIVQLKGANSGYYIGKRKFELPELKLLVDAVQSSKFITIKKSEELIRKLENLASKYEAKQLQRQVYIYNRAKTGNETIYYNVDQIHEAIYKNVQITFHYAEWTVKKELQLKRNGALYKVSPWALTWDDENYYLIGYDESADKIKYFRVDKMLQVHLKYEKRTGKERFEDFDLAAFAKKTFAMYGGYDEEVLLLCHNTLAGVILDRFGRNVWMVPEDEEHFQVKVTVSVSQQFFGWVTGIGDQMMIAGPEHVKKEYAEYLQNVLKNYKI